MPIDDFFWNNVAKAGEDECWLWTGFINPKGYGLIPIRKNNRAAHRFSYELHNGEIPDGMVIRHTCDTRSCVNPKHLVTGTHNDNVQDRVIRGRSAVGEKSGRSVLTDERVREIRDTYKNGGVSTRALAARFGISKSNVWVIVNGDGWKHLDSK